jgi:hypothetical protein
MDPKVDLRAETTAEAHPPPANPGDDYADEERRAIQAFGGGGRWARRADENNRHPASVGGAKSLFHDRSTINV